MNTAISDHQLNDDLKTTSTWLLIAFFLGWLALVVRLGLQGIAAHFQGPVAASSAYSSLTFTTATAFIWTLAWLTGGFLFGFVFGIPKVIAATTSATNPALNDPSQNPSPKLKVNTNLEDISDWLTKVLVGATLTQVVKIPGAIGVAAEFMSGNDATKPFSFNAALLIYYSSLGFLSGYILTRMFFARAFALADEGPSLSSEAAKTLDKTNVGFGLKNPTLMTDPSLRKAALASDLVPITESLSGEQALRLAKGATLTGDAARALTASRLAVQKNPDDPQAQLTYAWSLRKLGSPLDTVLPIVETAAQKLSSSSDPSVLTSVYASLAYLQLYQPPATGYENAIRTLEEYDTKQGQPDADIEINRACAFGQKCSYLRTNEASAPLSDGLQAELMKARKGALDSIRKAISLDPISSNRLKELLWSSTNSPDDDLAIFQNDVDFISLLPRS